jgi:hypothetical protein
MAAFISIPRGRIDFDSLPRSPFNAIGRFLLAAPADPPRFSRKKLKWTGPAVVRVLLGHDRAQDSAAQKRLVLAGCDPASSV